MNAVITELSLTNDDPQTGYADVSHHTYDESLFGSVGLPITS